MNKDNKKYSFNEKIAIEVGFEEACMFWNIYYWVIRNKDKEDHFHDGRCWMYSTVREFTEKYPFWTKAQIKRILTNLQEADYIDTGEYNKWNADRTKWYTITEKGTTVMNSGNAVSENENLEW